MSKPKTQKEELELTDVDYMNIKSCIDLIQSKGLLKIEEIIKLYPVYSKIQNIILIKNKEKDGKKI